MYHSTFHKTPTVQTKRQTIKSQTLTQTGYTNLLSLVLARSDSCLLFFTQLDIHDNDICFGFIGLQVDWFKRGQISVWWVGICYAGDITEYGRRRRGIPQLSSAPLHIKQDTTSIEKYTLKHKLQSQTQTQTQTYTWAYTWTYLQYLFQFTRHAVELLSLGSEICLVSCSGLAVMLQCCNVVMWFCCNVVLW